jgi:hypothetical protein
LKHYTPTIYYAVSTIVQLAAAALLLVYVPTPLAYLAIPLIGIALTSMHLLPYSYRTDRQYAANMRNIELIKKANRGNH